MVTNKNNLIKRCLRPVKISNAYATRLWGNIDVRQENCSKSFTLKTQNSEPVTATVKNDGSMILNHVPRRQERANR